MDVFLDRRRLDVEAGRDLLVGKARGDQTGDFELPTGEVRQHRRRPRPEWHADHQQRHAEHPRRLEVHGQARVGRGRLVEREDLRPRDGVTGLTGPFDRATQSMEIGGREAVRTLAHRVTLAIEAERDQDMSVDADREVIERYYRAMEAGSPDQMTTIFTEDAVYLEPFSRGGSATTHTGRPEIVGWLGASFETANRGVTITLDRIDVDGDEVVAEWTCVGPALPGPMKGHDRYTVRDGQIARLETRLGPAA